jgi:hypothetical protein
MDVSRRGFLKLMAATPVAIALPSEAKLWVPPHIEAERDVVELLKPVVSASEHGDLVYGWLLPDEFAPADIDSLLPTLLRDAYHYFPDGSALLALRREVIGYRRPGLGRRLQRFVWRGAGAPVSGASHQIAAAWHSRWHFFSECTAGPNRIYDLVPDNEPPECLA